MFTGNNWFSTLPIQCAGRWTVEESKEKVQIALAAWDYLNQICGGPPKHLEESYGLPAVTVLQTPYPKLASVCLRISAEHITPREKLFICSELPTVSSPDLMKGHQPLTRFCWNMEILFSALAATTMPRSQLLAVFAARGNPFRFSSRVPGGRSNVTTLRDRTEMNTFKQQLPDEIHGAMQQLGPKLQSWGSLCTIRHSFILPWHHLIQVPNYSFSKKCTCSQRGASEKDKQILGLRHTSLYVPL